MQRFFLRFPSMLQYDMFPEEHVCNLLGNFSNIIIIPFLLGIKKKSRIRETKHLSTDADSRTDAIGGWTKNSPKPDFF